MYICYIMCTMYECISLAEHTHIHTCIHASTFTRTHITYKCTQIQTRTIYVTHVHTHTHINTLVVYTNTLHIYKELMSVISITAIRYFGGWTCSWFF